MQCGVLFGEPLWQRKRYLLIRGPAETIRNSTKLFLRRQFFAKCPPFEQLMSSPSRSSSRRGCKCCCSGVMMPLLSIAADIPIKSRPLQHHCFAIFILLNTATTNQEVSLFMHNNVNCCCCSRLLKFVTRCRWCKVHCPRRKKNGVMKW